MFCLECILRSSILLFFSGEKFDFYWVVFSFEIDKIKYCTKFSGMVLSISGTYLPSPAFYFFLFWAQEQNYFQRSKTLDKTMLASLTNYNNSLSSS